MRLTDISIRQLALPEKGQRLYYDDTLPAFGCRVSQGGTRSFFVQHGADRQFITIGRYPIVSLADARAEAKRILAERTLGKHRPQTINWDAATEHFISTCEQKNRPRTVHDYRRLLDRHFPFGKRKLVDITSADINRCTDRLISTPSEQSHALTAVKVFFKWAQRKRYVEHSPCEGMRGPKAKPRDRVLSDAELIAVWRACEQPHPFHCIVRLCILLGQRRGEIGLLRANHVDWSARTITLPREIVKNNRDHTFPFGTLAEGILKTLPAEGYLFPGRYDGNAAFNGWAKCKREMDARLAHIAPWTLHDLRRTFATNLAALNVAPYVVEKLLNHASGTISGVAAIYNRYQFMNEMREAITAWDARLSFMLSPK